VPWALCVPSTSSARVLMNEPTTSLSEHISFWIRMLTCCGSPIQDTGCSFRGLFKPLCGPAPSRLLPGPWPPHKDLCLQDRTNNSFSKLSKPRGRAAAMHNTLPSLSKGRTPRGFRSYRLPNLIPTLPSRGPLHHLSSFLPQEPHKPPSEHRHGGSGQNPTVADCMLAQAITPFT